MTTELPSTAEARVAEGICPASDCGKRLAPTGDGWAACPVFDVWEYRVDSDGVLCSRRRDR